MEKEMNPTQKAILDIIDVEEDIHLMAHKLKEYAESNPDEKAKSNQLLGAAHIHSLSDRLYNALRSIALDIMAQDGIVDESMAPIVNKGERVH